MREKREPKKWKVERRRHKEESIVWPTEDTVAEITDQYKVGVGSYRATCVLQTQFTGILQEKGRWPPLTGALATPVYLWY